MHSLGDSAPGLQRAMIADTFPMLNKEPHCCCMKSQSVVGRPLQNTARAEPPKAMKTTLTAAGTDTMGSGKCFCARANPKAALCMPATQHLFV